MKWAGEGLKAFGQTMVEGKKDIRRGEDLLQQSELELIRSQTLRDQGKYAASEKAKQKSLDMEERGMRFAQSDAALNLKRAEMDINFAKLSSEIGAKEAEAFYKNAYGKLLQQGGPGALTAAAKAAGEGIDIGRLTTAKTLAEKDLKDKGIKNPTPAQIMEQAAFYYPAIKTIPVPKPQIRGLEAPATLAPGT
jgi:hypothetical protein